MSDPPSIFSERYAQGLRDHLLRPGEGSLNNAYELGRQAMVEGLGVLELANLHHRTLREMATVEVFEGRQDYFDQAAAFLAEGLSPFEMSLRGYREANEHLLSLNEELKQAKTAMEAANRELEAFSYSVAHDLRAPLRGLDGFSMALLEDYGDRLDAEGKQYLRNLRESAQHMAALIDDLLSLSRVTRSEFRREDVDLTEIAHKVVARLRRANPERKVDFHAASGLLVSGDERMMTIALENLLDNAWKFTGKRDEAKIRLELAEQGDHPVFAIRDNGAGFDMAYASKLFGVFQRLHSTAEFEGTGIGLATVQRVIRRHGGRIWAEGKVDQGATFFFTLRGRQDRIEPR